MKKILIALSLALTLSTISEAAAQRHRHHPVEQVEAPADSTPMADELVAFSDTASDDTAARQPRVVYRDYDGDDEDLQNLGRAVSIAFSQADGDDVAMMLFVVVIVAIIFLLAPLLIIGLIFYFVHKNRKERMRLAELSMKTGQPIPDGVIGSPAANASSVDGDLRAKGIRQLALGVGLMVFLGYSAGNIGFGIGVLVACMGVGKLVIARDNKKNQELNNTQEQ